MRGFFYTEHIPDGLQVNSISVSIMNTSGTLVFIDNYTFESGTSGDVYQGYTPYRWVVETPPSFSEDNPVLSDPNGSLEIVYTVTSATSGAFDFEEFCWVGYYQDIVESTFGYSEASDSQTVLFDSPPVAVDDPTVVDEDDAVTINVIANDYDDIDQSTVTIIDPPDPAKGSIVNNGNGTVTYTPVDDFYGSDIFTYTVKDNVGVTSNIATVSITVNPVNDIPTISDISDLATGEDIATGTISFIIGDLETSAEGVGVTRYEEPQHCNLTALTVARRHSRVLLACPLACLDFAAPWLIT